MKTTVKIFGFTLLTLVFYSYVGQMVPQKVTYPPEATEFGEDMTTEELVTVGQEIVEGKGTCLTCHTVGSEDAALRFPDLGDIGAVAGTRRDGYSDVEYLAESLYEPNAYIVEGFQGGMPNVSQPPIDLTDQEIMAVIAYLQSLGGTPTVTMDTELPYGDATAAAPAAPTPASTAAADGADGAVRDGATLFEAYLCNTCHSIDEPMQMVGPSLHDVGQRLSRAEIYEAIMDPDATIAEGFSAGVMTATLEAANFYEEISTQELKELVDFLAAQEGE